MSSLSLPDDLGENVLLFSIKILHFLLNLVNFSIKTMEMVKNKWDHFGSNFETLSIWITEKEKELNALEASSSAMDMQISQIKVTCSHIMFIICA